MDSGFEHNPKRSFGGFKFISLILKFLELLQGRDQIGRYRR